MQPGLAVVIQLVIASIVQAYNHGDVKLIGGDEPSFDGVLQVYLQGSWNTVCYDETNDFDTNEATAKAVCRQLGYNYNTYYYDDHGYDSSLSVITGFHCPVVMTSTEAEILILRCERRSSSEACDRLAITCEKSKYFYNGQVRIHHNNHYDNNYAFLEINLEEDWRPICISPDDMSSFAADSACRQMGYTSAKSHNPSEKFHKKSWKIDIQPHCSMGIRSSSPCFTDCINQYTSVDNCADDDVENVYELICVFDEDSKVAFSSGTETLCRYSSESIDVRFYSVTGSLSFVVFVLLIVVIVQCCCLHRCCRRQPPAAANNLAAEPNYGALRAQRQRED